MKELRVIIKWDFHIIAQVREPSLERPFKRTPKAGGTDMLALLFGISLKSQYHRRRLCSMAVVTITIPSVSLEIFKFLNIIIFMSFLSSAIDNQTLETIENTLKQFHAFLDILNEKG